MDSFWRNTSIEQLDEGELKVIKLSNIDIDSFKSYSVEINDKGDYIWTYEVGTASDEKPTIVIIHGFGASGMLFYQMFEKLSQEFHVVLLDLFGMGRSSRVEFEIEDQDECEAFFVDSIENWREKMGFDQMLLCGHSFGGYISACYSLKYPQNVKR